MPPIVTLARRSPGLNRQSTGKSLTHSRCLRCYQQRTRGVWRKLQGRKYVNQLTSLQSSRQCCVLAGRLCTPGRVGTGEPEGARTLAGLVRADAWPPSAAEPLTRLRSLSLSPTPPPPRVSPHLFCPPPVFNSRQPEAEGCHPEKHRDRAGRGDAQPDVTPSQP